MKNTRRLGNILFIGVTAAVFLTGTFFAFIHRSDPNADLISKNNILAVACGAFLTIAELALIYSHHLIHHSKEFWRRGTALLIALSLAGTITYATFTEAQQFLEEGNMSHKADIVSGLNEKQLAAAKTSRERREANAGARDTIKEVLEGAATPNFKPFAANALWGLVAALLCTFISPQEPWRRKRGNILAADPDLKGKIEKQIGFGLPEGAKAYDDGKGGSITLKKGREYLGSVPKSQLKDQV